MKTETLEEVKSLLSEARGLRNLLPHYRECIKDSRCDKHGISFTTGGDFNVFFAKANLSGYTGYYGSSNCGSLSCGLRQASAQQLLLAALNKHMETILNTMADIAENEAKSLKAKAQAEIEELTSMVANLAEQTKENQ